MPHYIIIPGESLITEHIPLPEDIHFFYILRGKQNSNFGLRTFKVFEHLMLAGAAYITLCGPVRLFLKIVSFLLVSEKNPKFMANVLGGFCAKSIFLISIKHKCFGLIMTDLSTNFMSITLYSKVFCTFLKWFEK